MSESEKREFTEWYNTFAREAYDVKKECTKYCIHDVDILRKSFEKFRKLFIDIFQ